MSDGYTPFGLMQVLPVTNPDGTVGWRFLGGVSLPAANNRNPPSGNKVTWTRAADGALIAQEIGSYDASNGGDLRLQSFGQAVDAVGSIELQAFSDPAADALAQLTLTGQDKARTGRAASVGASAGLSASAQSVNIIDSDGKSSFIQGVSPSNSKLQGGSSGFNTNGSGWQSFGFNFPGAFPNGITAVLYSIIGPAFAMGNCFHQLSSQSTTGFTINFYTTGAISWTCNYLAIGS